jgi:hypothetical protein
MKSRGNPASEPYSRKLPSLSWWTNPRDVPIHSDPSDAVRKRAHLVAARHAAAAVVVFDHFPSRRRSRPPTYVPTHRLSSGSASRLRIESPGRPSSLVRTSTDLARRQAIESAAGADPEAAVAPLHKCAHVVVAQALLGVERRERRIAQAQQAGVRAGPQAAFAIDGTARDAIVRQTALAAAGCRGHCADAQQAVVDRADPQSPAVSRTRLGTPSAGQQGRDGFEALAVATERAAFGAHVQLPSDICSTWKIGADGRPSSSL